MYREEEFTGVTIKFEFKRTNFKKDYGTDTLVYYQTGGFGNNPDVITVDNAADEPYSKWASIHECICCGRYRLLSPAAPDPRQRCGEIDRMIVEQMPEAERAPYIAKRIEMFQTLSAKKLNPAMEHSFRESLKILKQMQEELRTQS